MGVLKESDTDLLAVTLTSLSVRSGGGGEIKSYLNYAQNVPKNRLHPFEIPLSFYVKDCSTKRSNESK